jgi:hypothetical protein
VNPVGGPVRVRNFGRALDMAPPAAGEPDLPDYLARGLAATYTRTAGAARPG